MSTTEERAAAQKRFTIGKSVFDTVDERFGSSKFLTAVLDKIFPDHWSFMVGEIAMDSLIVLIATGIYLTFFYIPSGADVVYAPTSGHVYAPLVRPAHDRRLRVGHQPLVQRAVRAGHAPGPPLGRPDLPGRHPVPPVPDLLHRRLPQAAGDQLDHRPDPVDGRHARGLHRLLAARRPAVRHRAAGHLLDRPVHPVRRDLAGLQPVGRPLPRARASSRGCSSSTSSCSRPSSSAC